jgi:hypothetical protein
MNGKLAFQKCREAFRRRLYWLQVLGNYFGRIRRMVDESGSRDLVARRSGPRGEFAEVILVE